MYIVYMYIIIIIYTLYALYIIYIVKDEHFSSSFPDVTHRASQQEVCKYCVTND